jgi:hypothetical protein
MAGKDIFVKKGFMVGNSAKTDFDLLVFNSIKASTDPKFNSFTLDKYGNGLLTIIRSAQCPYSVKNVDAIPQDAKRLI